MNLRKLRPLLLFLAVLGAEAATKSQFAPPESAAQQPASNEMAPAAETQTRRQERPASQSTPQADAAAAARLGKALSQDQEYSALRGQINGAVQGQDWTTVDALAEKMEQAVGVVAAREQIDPAAARMQGAKTASPARNIAIRADRRPGGAATGSSAEAGTSYGAGTSYSGSAGSGSAASPPVGTPGTATTLTYSEFPNVTPTNVQCKPGGTQLQGKYFSLWHVDTTYEPCTSASLWRYTTISNPAPATATVDIHFSSITLETKTYKKAVSKALARALVYVRMSAGGGKTLNCMVGDKSEAIGPNSHNEIKDQDFTASCNLGSVPAGTIKLGPMVWIESNAGGAQYVSARSFAGVETMEVTFKY